MILELLGIVLFSAVYLCVSRVLIAKPVGGATDKYVELVNKELSNPNEKVVPTKDFIDAFVGSMKGLFMNLIYGVVLFVVFSAILSAVLGGFVVSVYGVELGAVGIFVIVSLVLGLTYNQWKFVIPKRFLDI